MANAHLVTIANSFKYLLEYLCRILLWKEFLLNDPFKQFSSLAYPIYYEPFNILLHHKVHIQIVFKVFIKFDNIGVIQGLKDANFGTKTLEVLNFRARNCFHCTLLPCDFVSCELNYSVWSTAQFLRTYYLRIITPFSIAYTEWISSLLCNIIVLLRMMT